MTGIDPARITEGYNFDWVQGSDDARRAGRERRGPRRELRRGPGLAVGDSLTIRTAENTSHEATIKGIYKPPPVLPAARDDQHLDGGVRRAVVRPRNQYTFINVAGRPVRVARAERRSALGLPGRGADPRGVDREGGPGVRPVPRDALRPARAVGDHQRLRHGQHARPLGLRADAGGGDAPRGRDDAPPDAPHDPPRERDHRADRSCARPSARDLPCRRS